MELALIEREASSTLDQAKEIVVASDEQYAMAGEFILGCKALLAKIDSEHEPSIGAAHKAHKAAIALRDLHKEKVEQAIAVASTPAMAYKREQDRLAKEEADQIAAAKRKADEERRLKEAEELEAAGKQEEAEKKLDEPLYVGRQFKFESPVPKVAGLSTRKKMKFRITQPSKVNRPFCLPDVSLCNQAVKKFYDYNNSPTPQQVQQLLDEIGGGEIYEDEVFAGQTVRARY